jgi:hypothetical protein
MIRDRWSIENSWHRVRDMILRQDAQRYREIDGVQILATLRSLAINALRLDGIWSMTEDIAALAHDIRGLLGLVGWREPAGGARPSGSLLIGPDQPRIKHRSRSDGGSQSQDGVPSALCVGR